MLCTQGPNQADQLQVGVAVDHGGNDVSLGEQLIANGSGTEVEEDEEEERENGRVWERCGSEVGALGNVLVPDKREREKEEEKQVRVNND